MRRDPRRHRLAPEKALSTPIPAEKLKDEVHYWAHRLGAEPGQINLVRLSRKWASCSPRGRVTFDKSLLSQPEEFRREVIIHELIHLKVPNHGALFSALLKTHMAGEGNIVGSNERVRNVPPKRVGGSV
jgi:predicted metal-dependent hydrolase